MASKRRSGQRAAYILWDLKLRGDVNENHAGGNASRTLFDRIIENGGRDGFQTFSQFCSTLNNLSVNGRIKRLSRGPRSYRITLQCDPSAVSDNPFVGTDLVPYTPDNEPSGEFSFVRAWPVSKRLELIAFASQSVQEDMHAFKSGVAESL
jgi:hypothetical protein